MLDNRANQATVCISLAHKGIHTLSSYSGTIPEERDAVNANIALLEIFLKTISMRREEYTKFTQTDHHNRGRDRGDKSWAECPAKPCGVVNGLPTGRS